MFSWKHILKFAKNYIYYINILTCVEDQPPKPFLCLDNHRKIGGEIVIASSVPRSRIPSNTYEVCSISVDLALF